MRLNINVNVRDRRALAAINDLKEAIMSQFDDLNSAISQLGTDLTEAVARVEAKVAELGEPDPDLTDAIQRIKDVGTGLDNVLPDVPSDTGPVDTGTPGPTDPGTGPGNTGGEPTPGTTPGDGTEDVPSA